MQAKVAAPMLHQGIANTYKTAFATSLSMGDKSNAAAMLKIEIPQIVSDLSRAQEDSQPMSDIDYKAVLNLGDFAARKIAILMSGDGIMTISNFAPTQTLRLGDLPQV